MLKDLVCVKCRMKKITRKMFVNCWKNYI